MGPTFHEYDLVDSTNDTARSLAREGAPEGTVVAARGQRRGRGQYGRDWESPRDGGLYLSLLLRPRGPAADLLPLTLLMGLATAEGVEAGAALPSGTIGLKWPNDLQIGTAKLGGILVEGQLQVPNQAVLIVGIGVNVNVAPADFSEALRPVATSVRIATGQTFDLSVLRHAVVAACLAHYTEWQSHGFSAILREAYRARHVLPGCRVRIGHGDATLTLGTVTDIDSHGALLVETDTGPRRLIEGHVVQESTS